MSDAQSTRTSRAWPSATLQSLVCPLFILISFRVLMVSGTATSADVERVFSRGRLILPHIRNGMSSQSIRALLCLGDWCRLGLVEDDDVRAVAAEADDGAE